MMIQNFLLQKVLLFIMESKYYFMVVVFHSKWHEWKHSIAPFSEQSKAPYRIMHHIRKIWIPLNHFLTHLFKQNQWNLEEKESKWVRFLSCFQPYYRISFPFYFLSLCWSSSSTHYIHIHASTPFQRWL